MDNLGSDLIWLIVTIAIGLGSFAGLITRPLRRRFRRAARRRGGDLGG
jgi:hypothetical protein